MNSAPSVWERIRAASGKLDRAAQRWLLITAWLMVAALSVLRFCYLDADFPNHSPWMDDQAKYTDEGWWASGAVMHRLLGHWNVPGDYNPAAALPVWPALLGIVFHFTGVSIVAARALNAGLSVATAGVVYLLVRRYSHRNGGTPPLLAALLLTASPFAFAFSRLAILETLVILEFCLLMLAASYASAKRIWLLAVIAALMTAMLLTKTTAALLAPAVLWLAWSAMGRKPAGLLRAVLAVAVIPIVLVKSYAALVSALGFGADYNYFFDVNAIDDFDWSQALSSLLDLLQHGFLIDRILYPTGLLILVVSIAWKRKLWSNPLFAASWIALGVEAAYILRRQDNFGPRYLLVLLVPLIAIVVLAFGEAAAHSRKAAAVFLLALAIAVGMNAAMIGQFMQVRTYQFRDAALSIKKIVGSDPGQKQLILSVSGSQLSLMTGIPSINDAYSEEEMAEKISLYQPGWYVAWNVVSDENRDLLSAYRLKEAAAYSVFDNDDRNKLILYKMIRVKP
jgi:hypothetical protein